MDLSETFRGLILIVAILLIAFGVAAIDWRIALIVTGVIVLVLVLIPAFTQALKH